MKCARLLWRGVKKLPAKFNAPPGSMYRTRDGVAAVLASTSRTSGCASSCHSIWTRTHPGSDSRAHPTSLAERITHLGRESCRAGDDPHYRPTLSTHASPDRGTSPLQGSLKALGTEPLTRWASSVGSDTRRTPKLCLMYCTVRRSPASTARSVRQPTWPVDSRFPSAE